MKTLSLAPLSKAPHPNQTLGTFNDFTLEVCMNEASKNAAFQIRYRANLEASGVVENEEGLIYDQSDFSPNVRIFLVWFQGKAIATIRSCAYSKRYDLLATEVLNYFQDELMDHIGEQASFLEANRFAVDPDFQGRNSIFACKLLFRAHGLNAAAHQSDFVVSLVRTNHQAFYKRYLGMEAIAQAPYYVEWAQAYETAVLLIQETTFALDTILKRGMPAFDQHDIHHYEICAGLSYQSNQRIAA